MYRRQRTRQRSCPRLAPPDRNSGVSAGTEWRLQHRVTVAYGSRSIALVTYHFVDGLQTLQPSTFHIEAQLTTTVHRGATTAEKLRGAKVWVPTPGHLRPAPGQRSGWVLGAGGGRPLPLWGSGGITTGKFLKTQMLNPAFWWLLAVKFLVFFWKLRPRGWGTTTLLVPQPKSWGTSLPGPYGCCAYGCTIRVGNDEGDWLTTCWNDYLSILVQWLEQLSSCSTGFKAAWNAVGGLYSVPYFRINKLYSNSINYSNIYCRSHERFTFIGVDLTGILGDAWLDLLQSPAVEAKNTFSYIVMQVIWCLKFCNMTKFGGTIPRSKFWGDLSPSSPRDLRPCTRWAILYFKWLCELFCNRYPTRKRGVIGLGATFIYEMGCIINVLWCRFSPSVPLASFVRSTASVLELHHCA